MTKKIEILCDPNNPIVIIDGVQTKCGLELVYKKGAEPFTVESLKLWVNS